MILEFHTLMPRKIPNNLYYFDMVGELKANQNNKAEINMRIILQIHSAHCSAVHAAVVHCKRVIPNQLHVTLGEHTVYI